MLTPVLRPKVALRADSSTIDYDAENDEPYEARHFDRTKNKLNYDESVKVNKQHPFVCTYLRHSLVRQIFGLHRGGIRIH
jgi:hypothetical protein